MNTKSYHRIFYKTLPGWNSFFFEGRTVPSKPPLPWPTLSQLNFKCALIFDNIVWKEFFFLSAVLVIRAGFVSRENLFFFAFFSLEGTRLRVAKAARSSPCLHFLGRRFCVLILSEF